MNAFAAAGGAFLIAVLWFDLMFDVQARKQDGSELPPRILASISAYYRRVTTEARPMNRLIAAIMLLTLLAIVIEILRGRPATWIGWLSLASALAGIGLAMARTVPNAVRLGGAADSPAIQTSLARAIYHDHLFSLAAMALLVALQLSAAP